MALRKPTDTAKETKPVFESEDSAPQVSEPVVQEQMQIVSAQSEQKALVVPPAEVRSQPRASARYKPAFEDFKNQIDPSTLDFDTFPRMKVGLGGFSDDKQVEFGKRIVLRLMSWNERWTVTAGEDNDEANALVRFSLDGKTIDGTGELVADYIKNLKEVEGYTKAESKKYYAIYGFLVAGCAEGEKTLVGIDPASQPIISVQVPPRSVSQFTRLQIEQGVKVSQGVLQPTDTILLTQIKNKGKTKDYAGIEFTPYYD